MANENSNGSFIFGDINRNISLKNIRDELYSKHHKLLQPVIIKKKS